MIPPLASAAFPRAFVFAADVAASSSAAWLVVCGCGLRGRGLLEVSLAWWLSLVALVGGAGVVLGESGGLGPAGFLCVHAAVLLVLAAARWRSRSPDLRALAGTLAAGRRLLNGRGPESVATLCVFLAVAALSVVAAWSQPATADALSYHLPRIGQWLLDGRITVLATADARMNYTAVVPDLVMAWLIGGFGAGFRPSDLAQVMGGIMALGATVGLARQAGLGRCAAVLAAALLFGMANVAVQFTASQTDLFTAGVFAAAFYLWYSSLRRGEGSALGGAGAGLALGAKGTMFYLAPSVALWVALAAWRHRAPRAAWLGTLTGAALGVALFAGPGFARNWRAYGDVLGPKEWVSMHHQGAPSALGLLQKLDWNLTTSLAQAFEPQSQPLGLRTLGRTVVAALEKAVPESDPYTYVGMGRRERMQNAFLHRTQPDADYVSFGIVTLVLFLAGTAAALAAWRRPEGRTVASWAAGVAVFLVFFNVMQQWHPYGFRYLVLAAPWVAVVCAWGIERLRGALRACAWALALAAAANVGWRVTTQAYQSGLRAALEPEQSLTFFASSRWAVWSAGLGPGAAPLSLSLPYGSAVAAFYRQPLGRAVRLRAIPGREVGSAEEFVRGEPGWAVVSPTLFLGREGRVAASVWLFNGDPASPFSVAAYRRLGPGEEPRPVVYGDSRGEGPGAIERRLLVKTWGAEPVRFRLANPRPGAAAYRLLTPGYEATGEVPAGGARTVEVALPAGRVSEVEVFFEGAGASAPPEPGIEPNPPGFRARARPAS
jgi:hypothetical protein